MKRRVELVYDADCPNVGSARTALLEAFAQRGLPAAWSEWERHDPEAPSYVRSCGSPTVLVDGRDTVPPLPRAAETWCRLYETESERLQGAPPVNSIAAALGRGSKARLLALLAPLPGALAALLPSCPFCWPLYAGALSALGLGYLLNEEHMPLVAAVLLLLTLLPLAYRVRERHGYGPLLVGVLGSGAVLLGKFLLGSDATLYAGLATLLAAHMWNIRRRDGKNCSRCETA
ncbi:MAG: hypothetical protein GC160_15405 [Acidobacteria bacterium]|nr:hypothetical protein [Acidobacteriota bacterium]